MNVWYVDTSALTKLVRLERESSALRRWLRTRTWIISDLHRTELRRAAQRIGGRSVPRAEQLLSARDVLRIDVEVFDAAGLMTPPELRSLDAIHLAAARTLGPDLGGIVAYDDRLLDAARETDVAVASPGRARSRT